MATRRRRRKFGDDIGVEMSPLIDCVFLLLIFFLVTTMMKKLEKQIPVVMPDTQAMAATKADNDRTVIGILADGQYISGDVRGQRGGYLFSPVPNIDERISWIIEDEGVAANLRVYAAEDTPFQLLIDLLDKLKNKNFENIDVRMLDIKNIDMHNRPRTRKPQK